MANILTKIPWVSRHEDAFFGLTLVLSLSAHAAVAGIGLQRAGGPPDPLVVIDLTQTVQPARVAPPAAKPAPPPPKPAENWNLPKPGETPPPPAPEAPAPEPEPAAPEGGPIGDLKRLSRLPRLLNAMDLRRNINRFYPPSERERGGEGNVVLDLVINEKGQVVSVAVVKASSLAFGEAAHQAAKLLRYSPACLGKDPVSVKLRQAFVFKIESCPGGCLSER